MMPGYFILPPIQIALSICLFLFVAYKGQRSGTQRLFLGFLGALGLWGIIIFGMRASPDIQHALFWEHMVFPLSLFMSVLFYHFSVSYRGTSTKRKPLLIVLYFFVLVSIPLEATDLVLEGMQVKRYGYAPVFGPLGPFFICLSFLLAVSGLINFFKIIRQSRDSEARIRAFYVFLGGSFSLIGMVFDILPVLGLPLYPGFIIGNLFFCVLTSIAILKHGLLEIHIVLRRTSAYFLTLATLTFPLLIFLIFVPRALGSTPLWVTLLVLSPPVLGFPFIWAFLQSRVERLFHRERYDYLRALQVFNRDAQSLLDSDRLGERLVDFLSRILRTEGVYLFLPSTDDVLRLSTSTDTTTGDMHLKYNSALISWLTEHKNFASNDDLELIPHFIGNEREVLSKLGAKAVMPMVTATGNLSGLIVLGKKISDQSFSLEDQQFVATLANQMATKFENVHLYNQATYHKRELEALSHRLVQVQEEERRAIARELHDEIGQTLIMTKILVDQQFSSTNGKEKLIQAQSMLKEVISQVREISLNLRPSILDDLGLIPALHWLIERYTARTGIKVNFQYSPLAKVINNNVITAAYRVVQESLSNIAKHAKVTEASIFLNHYDDALQIAIEDSGIGFDRNQVKKNSTGLMGMRERVTMLGGRMDIESAPHCGTRIKMKLPYEGRADGKAQ